mmetsp:Transcript_16190/g.44859  ORF Transcript_16190/g.44859 Transcript_16190/m.44859 type:complete len:102 (-) Transcript_16190:188-493(-)
MCANVDFSPSLQRCVGAGLTHASNPRFSLALVRVLYDYESHPYPKKIIRRESIDEACVGVGKHFRGYDENTIATLQVVHPYWRELRQTLLIRVRHDVTPHS